MAATSRMGVLLLLAACGGGDGAGRSDTTGAATLPPAQQPATGSVDTARDTSLAPAAPSAGESASTTAAKPSAGGQDTARKGAATATKPAGGGALSPKLIALGDSIFHGQVAGGTCTACHGQDAKGTAVAPDLTDQQWINIDGSYESIVQLVTNGVPQPKQHPAPMPPKGGAALNDEQVKAVAAYVYSLSHKS